MVLSTKELIEFYKSGKTVQIGGGSRPSTSSSQSTLRTSKMEDSDDEKKYDKKPDIRRLEQGTKYAVKYQNTEQQRLISASISLMTTDDGPSKKPRLDTAEDEMHFALDGTVDAPSIPEMSVYDKYPFDIPPQDLPIKQKKEEIMDQINKNMFIVLTANTGTGKSTQIPQYILEDARKRREKCNIIVTQPKRIAARSVATRVAVERDCKLGTLVGYQVGSDKQVDEKVNSDTRILFCTTGVLLQKLVNEKSLKNYTHVIVDEIHERDINIDMLLIVLRRLVATKNSDVKIILMSATMDSTKLANYFITCKPYGEDLGEISSPAPVLDLNIPSPYEIEFKYLDDLKELVGAVDNLVDQDTPGISDELYAYAVRTMIYLIDQSHLNDIVPSFVVFLPGLYEIERFKRALYNPNASFNVCEFKISVLHSQVSDDMRVCNENVDNRIILATNIAESSVTLPGMRFVIDFCLTKYNETDAASNSTRLKLDWAPENSLRQRAGRVGRMARGQVIRLITKHHFSLLPTEALPEIKRISLEFAVLKTKQLDLGRPAAVLALALDPPDKKFINDAIINLKEIGAITRFDKDGKFSSKDGDLTSMGKIMSILPVDVRIAKLIVLGYTFRCLNECIIMGIGLNSRSIFTLTKSDAKHKLEEYEQKLEFSRGSASDPIAMLNAYNSWCEMMKKTKTSGDNKETEHIRYKWCEKQFLSLKNLRQMDHEISDMKSRLRRQQFDIEDNFPFNEEKKIAVLKMCLAGAFYPNLFVFGGDPLGHEGFKAMKALNPCNVVSFKGIKRQNIMKLYKTQIAENLQDVGVIDDPNAIKIHQPLGTQKMFIEFLSLRNDERKAVPGQVKIEVYKALKLRKLDYEFEVRVIRDESTEKKNAIIYGFGDIDKTTRHFNYSNKCIKNAKYCIYPSKMHESGSIIHIIDCGKFFFRPTRAAEILNELTHQMEKCYQHLPRSRTIEQNSLVLVKFEDRVRRAKVLDVPDPDSFDPKYEIYLIDLGRTAEVDKEDFCVMAGETSGRTESLTKHMFSLPPQCYECRLSSVIPSPIRCCNGWSVESTRHFENFIKDKKLSIKIKSFVDLIASVEVYVENNDQFSNSLNDDLIIKQYALASDDSYMQHKNQIKRQRLLEENAFEKFEEYEDAFAEEPQYHPPEILYNAKIKLEGPMTEIEVPSVEKLAAFVSTNLCQIEPASVNSVLLDPYPFDTSKKVLVAASLVEKGNTIHLSSTTILPHVQGMSTIVALIFAPLTEIRLNSHKNRVSNILCGLGGLKQNDKMKSIFGEHDVLVRNDIALDKKFIDSVNKLRSKMSSILLNRLEMNKQFCAEERDKLCTLLLDILSEKKRLVPINAITDADEERHWTNVHEIKQENDVLYPPHFLPDMTPLSDETRQRLKENVNEEANRFINGHTNTFECKLCALKKFDSPDDLQVHLLTNLHIDRLFQLRDEQTPM